MSDLSRRTFLGTAAAVTGAAAAGVASSGTRAQAASPRAVRKQPHQFGDIRDVRHVVILMQENRSFDHYFGSLKGVRGFGDRSTIMLPGGLSVFQQPTSAPGTPVADTQYPWRLSAAPPSAYPDGHRPPDSEVGAQGYGGTSHSWDDQHLAWSGGLMNGWVSAKGGPTTLGFLNRDDIPFHYALADTYTVGDAYHCSVLSATGPNRTYLWSGTVDAQQKHSSFVAYNGGDEIGRDLLWETYAETLQQAGMSWRVYQCADDYGDNGLEYFATFARYDPTQGGTPAPGNPYYDNGVANVAEPRTGVRANADNLADAIRTDVLAGTLPQVSWVVTNQAFSEHPDGAPNDGAYYVNGVLEALHADPDVFNSTLVIINYDENDGQFDHVPPPVPAAGTTDEFYYEASGALAGEGVTAALPVGLGFRVPLLLVSPWTRGGWVTSEVSDHTSVIQFLEKWSDALGTPATSPNISAWRRSVCGDLTGAFNFAAPVYGLPDLPRTTVIGDPTGGSYHPPAADNVMPTQERGSKRARPLPYQPNANLDAIRDAGDGRVTARLLLSNAGAHVRKASHFAVYDNTAPGRSMADYPAMHPTQCTVAPSPGDTSAATSVEINAGTDDGRYDLTVVGPNRFLRQFTGNAGSAGAAMHVTATYRPRGGDSGPILVLELTNEGSRPLAVTVAADNYSTDRPRRYHLPAHGSVTHVVDPLASSGGWYDLSVTLDADPSWSRRYVGHLENGGDSVTG